MSNILKVSIITVSFNSAATIEETILSVINQSYEELEYIIIDGGSTDGTVDIIKKYENKIAYWISESDNGIYDAMNKAIKKSTGEFIGIINSDDWYEADAVKKSIEALIVNPDFDAVCSDIWVHFYYRGEYLVKKSVSNPDTAVLKRTMGILHPTVFAHRKFYKQYGLFDLDFKIAADYDLMLRAILQGAVIGYTPCTTVNFRLGGVSSDLWKTRREVMQVRKKNNLSGSIQLISFIKDIKDLLLFHIAQFLPKSFMLNYKINKGWKRKNSL